MRRQEIAKSREVCRAGGSGAAAEYACGKYKTPTTRREITTVWECNPQFKNLGSEKAAWGANFGTSRWQRHLLFQGSGAEEFAGQECSATNQSKAAVWRVRSDANDAKAAAERKFPQPLSFYDGNIGIE